MLPPDNHRYFELITDYLKNVEGEYGGIRRTLQNAAMENHIIFKGISIIFYQNRVTNLVAPLVLFKLPLP